MVKILPALLIAATVLAGIVHFAAKTQTIPAVPVEIKEAYSQWCKLFGKLRASPEEHNFRMKQFQSAFEFIQRHNANPKKSHTVALNQFADLTDEEFHSVYSSQKFDKSAGQGFPEESVEPETTSLGQVPENVDMRAKLQQLSMQGSSICNDNYAWVSAVAMNANYYMSRGTIRYQFSPQTYIDCSANFGNQGCTGGQAFNSFKYSEKFGVATLADYPYYGTQRGCRATTGMFSNLRTMNPPELSNSYLKNFLLRKAGVIAVGLDMTSNEARYYKGGIFKGPCSTNPSQNLLLVGMGIDTFTNYKYWIVMNTWGSFWGDQGIMKIARFEQDNDSRYSSCGLNMWASFPEF
jgi:KDEL-tailed cysteine endopeptidase